MNEQEELRKANERFQLVSLATNDAVWDWDLVSNGLWWNDGFFSLFGYRTVEPTLESWTTRVHPDDKERVLHGIHALIESGQKTWSDEYRFLRADGSWADIFDRGFVMHDENGRPVRMIGAMMDVTDARRASLAQAALTRVAEAAASAPDLDELLRAIHDIVATLLPAKNFYIALLRPEGDRVEFPYFLDEHDQPPTGPEPLGRGLTAYVLRTGKSLLLCTHAQFEELVRQGEVEGLGTPAVSWVGVPLRSKQSTIGVLVAQSYDESVLYTQHDEEILQFVSTQIARAIERKQADEALRESERRFRALIENSSDGILLLEGTGEIKFRSAGMERILGIPREAPLGRPRLYLHPDDLEESRGVWERVLASPGVAVTTVARMKNTTTGWRSLEFVLVNLLDDPAVRGVVANIRDITDRKQIEAKLMAADRMVSIGTLAAGVAHEINNPLAYVTANLSLIADRLAQPGPVDATELREVVTAARDGAERVRHIVRGLKTFSRGGEDHTGPVDVHRVLDEAVQIAGNEIRHRATLLRNYGAELPPVCGNEGRLGQVFLNLIVNAAQAMPEGKAASHEIHLRTARECERVVVEVQDTGAGIPPEYLDRLFDPFFTTKPVGVGTGLGLFICKSIVDSMGGTIAVESKLGHGTTFRVSLPVGRTHEAAAAPAPAATVPAARARLLVVDDEVQIGAVLKRALASHDVTALTSAEEALGRIRGGERYDLVLCDLMMPHMTGMDLHEALAGERPELARRIVFLTGGAFTPRAREFLDRIPNDRVDKPFDIRALRARVDRLLQGG